MAVPFPYIARWLKITLNMTQENNARVMTFNYRYPASGALTPAQCNQLALAFWTWIEPLVKPAMVASVTFNTVEARDMSAIGAAVGSYTIPNGTVGTRPGVSTPGNVALVISWRTGLAGRAHRGRSFLCGISTSDITISAALNGLILAAGNLAQTIVLFPGASGIVVEQVIPSRVLGVLTPVTTYIINSALDSMRKRLLTRGR